MTTPYVLAGIFVVISAFLAYFAIKKVFRLASTVLTIVALALAIVVFGISYDVQRFQGQLATDDKLFVLEEDGVLKAAFVHRNQPAPLLLSDLSAEREALVAGDLKALKGERALVIITKPAAYANVDAVDINGNKLPAQTILAMLAKDDPRQDYIAEIRRINNIPPGQEVYMPEVNVNEFKGVLLAALVNEYLHAHSLVQGVHDGHVRVYPSSITTWVMDTLPYPVLKYILQVN